MAPVHVSVFYVFFHIISFAFRCLCFVHVHVLLFAFLFIFIIFWCPAWPGIAVLAPIKVIVFIYFHICLVIFSFFLFVQFHFLLFSLSFIFSIFRCPAWPDQTDQSGWHTV